MGDAARKVATYEDVLNVPEHLVAELVHGVLHTHPRPSVPHAAASTELTTTLNGSLRKFRGVPGGCRMLIEPELHLGRDVLVPDLAGWKIERLPTIPQAASIELAPDWGCEVLSPSTRTFDRKGKLPLYASNGVPHVWLLEPTSKLLEVFRLDGETYRLISTHADDETVKAEPFPDVEVALTDLWGN